MTCFMSLPLTSTYTRCFLARYHGLMTPCLSVLYGRRSVRALVEQAVVAQDGSIASNSAEIWNSADGMATLASEEKQRVLFLPTVSIHTTNHGRCGQTQQHLVEGEQGVCFAIAINMNLKKEQLFVVLFVPVLQCGLLMRRVMRFLRYRWHPRSFLGEYASERPPRADPNSLPSTRAWRCIDGRAVSDSKRRGHCFRQQAEGHTLSTAVVVAEPTDQSGGQHAVRRR